MIKLFSILIYFSKFTRLFFSSGNRKKSHLIISDIINAELIVQPSESIIFREQFQPFIALCSAERNTRVGSSRNL